MKYIIYVLFLSAIISLSNAQWVQYYGNPGITVNSFAISGNWILAGTSEGVLRTQNSGGGWLLISSSINVLSLGSWGNIFAGTSSNGVIYTANNGNTWSQTNMTSQHVNCILKNGSDCFTGTNNTGIYRSVDNGINWSQTSLNNKTVYSIIASGYLYAGTASYGVYRSSSGLTWNQSGLSDKHIYSLAILGNNIFAGSGYGIYISTNNGTTWNSRGLNNLGILSITVNGNNIFVGTYQNGIYLSSDNGNNWLDRNEGFSPLPSVNALLIANNYIFAGTRGECIWRRPLAEIFGIVNISSDIPKEFSLSQNYPNPFNPSTNIKVDIPSKSLVKLTIFNALGNEISTLINMELNAGIYKVDWDASNYPSGVYFYNLNSGDYAETKKMVLVK